MKRNKILYLPLIIFAVCFASADSFAQQEDSLRIDYNYINSIPQNAMVFLNDSLAGETPFRFIKSPEDSSLSLTVTLKLEGYIDYSFHISPGDMPVNKTITLVLKNKLSLNSEKQVEVNSADYFKTPRKIVPIVVSSVVAAGSGALSYYFKKLANDRYDEYLATGNRDKFDQTKKYDLYSGIFLAAFQVGFAVFLYFLLID
jgi:PEGA domain